MNKLSTCFRKSIGWFDWYSDQPRLLSNRLTKFTSACGVALSILFLLTCLLIFVPTFAKYVRKEYLEQTIETMDPVDSDQARNYVTGRDIFIGFAARRRSDGMPVDLT